MKMENNRKVILHLAKEKINAGLSKQKAYEELSSEFRNRNVVAALVRSIPTRARKEKYDIYNILFLTVLGVVTVLYAISSPMVGLAWFGWLIYIVAARDYRNYYWITLLGTMGIIGSICLSLFGVFNLQVPGQVIFLSVIFSAVFIVFGIVMPLLMTPAYRSKKEYFLNSKGEKKLRVVHFFEESEKKRNSLSMHEINLITSSRGS